jgi:hypothetical protein
MKSAGTIFHVRLKGGFDVTIKLADHHQKEQKRQSILPLLHLYIKSRR